MKKKITASITLVCFLLNGAFTAPSWAEVSFHPSQEVRVPQTFHVELAPELGIVEGLVPGSGPAIVHIQTAHGNYEAQKKIQSILNFLHQRYGFQTLLVEGSSFRLHPRFLNFVPGQPDLNREVADRLNRKALIKGPELFLMDAPEVEGWGIEDLEDYLANGNTFQAALEQREKVRPFLEAIESQITRLVGAYLPKDLKDFLKEEERFEEGRFDFGQWLEFLQKKSKETLGIDLSEAKSQFDWPMLVRFAKLKAFEAKMDLKAFEHEREKFLRLFEKRGSSQDVERIRELLMSPLSESHLPDPETGLLFERMLSYLPPSFDYRDYPNLNLFIGHLILQSELRIGRLPAEASELAGRIAEHLSQNEKEKRLASLLKDFRLLKKLFALELTPDEHARVHALRPSQFVPGFLEINSENRVKDLRFEHLDAMDALFDRALEFYQGARKRDSSMLKNIEARLRELGVQKAVVVTGGFHAAPFREYFRDHGYSYALISPRISEFGGEKEYFQSILSFRTATAKTAAYETAPFVSTLKSELRTLGYDPEKVRTEVFKTVDAVLSSNPIKAELKQTFERSEYLQQFSVISRPQAEKSQSRDFSAPAGLRNDVRIRSEVREESSASWLRDPEKVNWTKATRQQKWIWVKALLMQLGETPQGLIARADDFQKTPIDFLNGKTLKPLYDYYDKKRISRNSPFSTVKHILYDAGFTEFSGREAIHQYQQLDGTIQEDSREVFAKASKEIGMDDWVHLFETNQSGLFDLMAGRYEELGKDEASQKSLLALLSEEFWKKEEDRPEEEKEAGARAFQFKDLEKMEKSLAVFLNEDFKKTVGADEWARILNVIITQIRSRLYREIVTQARAKNGASEAENAIKIAKTWFEDRSKKKGVPPIVKKIYEDLKKHYEELELADYQQYVKLKDKKTGQTVYLKLHQLEGIHFALKNKRIILGDEMGLGKTVQALATIMASKAERVVIVASKTLLANWKREIGDWLDMKNGEAEIIDGVGKARHDNLKKAIKKKARFILINYESLRRKDIVDTLNEWKPDYKIGDEIHRIRNAKSTKKTDEAEGYHNLKADRILNLSGSSIVNRTGDLWPLLYDIAPDDFPGSSNFVSEFAKDPVSSVRLRNRLNGRYLLRRTTDEVMVGLPKVKPVEYKTVPLKSRKRQRIYEEWLRRYNSAKWYETKKIQEKLRQTLVPPKLSAALKLTKEILDKGESVMIVSRHPKVVFKMQEMFQKQFGGGDAVSMIHRNLSTAERGRVVDQFQTDPAKRIFLTTYGVGSEGLTLTKANHVIFIDLPYTKAQMQQTIGRVAREGQTKEVSVHALIVPGTIDSDVVDILKRKETVFDEVVNGRIGGSARTRAAEELDRKTRQASQASRVNDALQIPYSHQDRGEHEEGKKAWDLLADSYSEALEHMAAFPITQALFWHMIQLHKEGKIDLKKMKKWLLAPSGPSTDIRAIMAAIVKNGETISVASELKKIGVDLGKVKVTEMDSSPKMLAHGREKQKGLGAHTHQVQIDLTEEELKANQFDFVSSSEIGKFTWRGKDSKNSKGVVRRNWALGQLVKSVKNDGLILLWGHNGSFPDATKEFLKETLGLELVHDVDRITKANLPHALRAKIERASFLLLRKVKEVPITTEFLAGLSPKAFHFRQRKRTAGGYAQTPASRGNGKNATAGTDLLDYLAEGAFTEHTEIANGEGKLSRNAILKSLWDHRQEAVDGTAEAAMEWLKGVLSQYPAAAIGRKIANFFRYYIATKREWQPFTSDLNDLLEKIRTAKLPAAMVKKEEKEKKGPKRGPGRPSKKEAGNAGKEIAKALFDPFIDLATLDEKRKGKGNILVYFQKMGYEFKESPVPVFDVLGHEIGSKSFWVDPYFLSAPGLTDLDRSLFLNLKVLEHFKLLFSDQYADEHIEETKIEWRQKLFKPMNASNRDLEALEQMEPDQTDLFHFAFELRQELAAAGAGKRSEARSDAKGKDDLQKELLDGMMVEPAPEPEAKEKKKKGVNPERKTLNQNTALNEILGRWGIGVVDLNKGRSIRRKILGAEIKEVWEDFHKPLLKMLRGNLLREEREIILRIYAALTPRLAMDFYAGRITSADTGKVRRELVKEKGIETQGRGGSHERMASILAQAGLKKNLEYWLEDALQKNFRKQYEDLLQAKWGHFRIDAGPDSGNPYKIKILLERHGEKDQVLAWLGTGYEIGNLQGQWHFSDPQIEKLLIAFGVEPASLLSPEFGRLLRNHLLALLTLDHKRYPENWNYFKQTLYTLLTDSKASYLAKKDALRIYQALLPSVPLDVFVREMEGDRRGFTEALFPIERDIFRFEDELRKQKTKFDSPVNLDQWQDRFQQRAGLSLMPAARMASLLAHYDHKIDLDEDSKKEILDAFFQSREGRRFEKLKEQGEFTAGIERSEKEKAAHVVIEYKKSGKKYSKPFARLGNSYEHDYDLQGRWLIAPHVYVDAEEFYRLYAKDLELEEALKLGEGPFFILDEQAWRYGGLLILPQDEARYGAALVRDVQYPEVVHLLGVALREDHLYRIMGDYEADLLDFHRPFTLETIQGIAVQVLADGKLLVLPAKEGQKLNFYQAKYDPNAPRSELRTAEAEKMQGTILDALEKMQPQESIAPSRAEWKEAKFEVLSYLETPGGRVPFFQPVASGSIEVRKKNPFGEFKDVSLGPELFKNGGVLMGGYWLIKAPGNSSPSAPILIFPSRHAALGRLLPPRVMELSAPQIALEDRRLHLAKDGNVEVMLTHPHASQDVYEIEYGLDASKFKALLEFPRGQFEKKKTLQTSKTMMVSPDEWGEQALLVNGLDSSFAFIRKQDLILVFQLGYSNDLYIGEAKTFKEKRTRLSPVAVFDLNRPSEGRSAIQYETPNMPWRKDFSKESFRVLPGRKFEIFSDKADSFKVSMGDFVEHAHRRLIFPQQDGKTDTDMEKIWNLLWNDWMWAEGNGRNWNIYRQELQRYFFSDALDKESAAKWIQAHEILFKILKESPFVGSRWEVQKIYAALMPHLRTKILNGTVTREEFFKELTNEYFLYRYFEENRGRAPSKEAKIQKALAWIDAAKSFAEQEVRKGYFSSELVYPELKIHPLRRALELSKMGQAMARKEVWRPILDDFFQLTQNRFPGITSTADLETYPKRTPVEYISARNKKHHKRLGLYEMRSLDGDEDWEIEWSRAEFPELAEKFEKGEELKPEMGSGVWVDPAQLFSGVIVEDIYESPVLIKRFLDHPRVIFFFRMGPSPGLAGFLDMLDMNKRYTEFGGKGYELRPYGYFHISGKDFKGRVYAVKPPQRSELRTSGPAGAMQAQILDALQLLDEESQPKTPQEPPVAAVPPIAFERDTLLQDFRTAASRYFLDLQTEELELIEDAEDPNYVPFDLNTSIHHLKFEVRIKNALEPHVFTIRDLLSIDQKYFRKMRGMGKDSFEKMKRHLEKYGIFLVDSHFKVSSLRRKIIRKKDGAELAVLQVRISDRFDGPQIDWNINWKFASFKADDTKPRTWQEHAIRTVLGGSFAASGAKRAFFPGGNVSVNPEVFDRDAVLVDGFLVVRALGDRRPNAPILIFEPESDDPSRWKRSLEPIVLQSVNDQPAQVTIGERIFSVDPDGRVRLHFRSTPKTPPVYKVVMSSDVSFTGNPFEEDFEDVITGFLNQASHYFPGLKAEDLEIQSDVPGLSFLPSAKKNLAKRSVHELELRERLSRVVGSMSLMHLVSLTLKKLMEYPGLGRSGSEFRERLKKAGLYLRDDGLWEFNFKGWTLAWLRENGVTTTPDLLNFDKLFERRAAVEKEIQSKLALRGLALKGENPENFLPADMDAGEKKRILKSAEIKIVRKSDNAVLGTLNANQLSEPKNRWVLAPMPLADEIEKIRSLIGFRLPMWMKEGYEGRSPEFEWAARNALLISAKWETVHEPLLTILKTREAASESKELVKWAYAAAVPNLSAKIISGTWTEEELRAELENEKLLYFFEQEEVNYWNRNVRDQEDLIEEAAYVRKWEGNTVRVDEARLAAMFARSRPKTKFTPESEKKLIQDAEEKSKTVIDAKWPAVEELVIRISKDSRISNGTPYEISKVEIVHKDNSEIVYAVLGTGYESGNLQGQWYFEENPRSPENLIYGFLAQARPQFPDLKAEELSIETASGVQIWGGDKIRPEKFAVSELKLSGKAWKALDRKGITRLTGLLNSWPKDLLNAEGFGQTSLREVREKLFELGFYLRGDEFWGFGLLPAEVSDLQKYGIKDGMHFLRFTDDEWNAVYESSTDRFHRMAVMRYRDKANEFKKRESQSTAVRIVRKNDPVWIATLPRVPSNPHEKWSIYSEIEKDWTQVPFPEIQRSFPHHQGDFKRYPDWRLTIDTEVYEKRGALIFSEHAEKRQNFGVIRNPENPEIALVFELNKDFERVSDYPAAYLELKPNSSFRTGDIIIRVTGEKKIEVVPVKTESRSEMRTSKKALELQGTILDALEKADSPAASTAEAEVTAAAAARSSKHIQSFLAEAGKLFPDLKPEDLEVRKDYPVSSQLAAEPIRLQLKDFEWSIRVANALESGLEIQSGEVPIQRLLEKTPLDLLEFPNFGMTSLNEVREKLRERRLFLKADDLWEIGFSKIAFEKIINAGITSLEQLLNTSFIELVTKGISSVSAGHIQDKLALKGLSMKDYPKVIRKKDGVILGSFINKRWRLNWSAMEFPFTRGTYQEGEKKKNSDEIILGWASLEPRLNPKTGAWAGGLLVHNHRPGEALKTLYVVTLPQDPGYILFFDRTAGQNSIHPVAGIDLSHPYPLEIYGRRYEVLPKTNQLKITKTHADNLPGMVRAVLYPTLSDFDWTRIPQSIQWAGYVYHFSLEEPYAVSVGEATGQELKIYHNENAVVARDIEQHLGLFRHPKNPEIILIYKNQNKDEGNFKPGAYPAAFFPLIPGTRKQFKDIAFEVLPDSQVRILPAESVTDWTQVDFSGLPKIFGAHYLDKDGKLAEEHLNYSLEKSKPFQLPTRTDVGVPFAILLNGEKIDFGMIRHPQFSKVILVFDLEQRGGVFGFRNGNRPMASLNLIPGEKTQMKGLIFEALEDGLMRIVSASGKNEKIEAIKEGDSVSPADWTKVAFPAIQLSFGNSEDLRLPPKRGRLIQEDRNDKVSRFWGIIRNPQEPQNIALIFALDDQGQRKSNYPAAFLKLEEGEEVQIGELTLRVQKGETGEPKIVSFGPVSRSEARTSGPASQLMNEVLDSIEVKEEVKEDEDPDPALSRSHISPFLSQAGHLFPNLKAQDLKVTGLEHLRPAKANPDTSIRELRLGPRAFRGLQDALHESGLDVFALGGVESLTAEMLLLQEGFGELSLKELREKLWPFGYFLKGEEPLVERIQIIRKSDGKALGSVPSNAPNPIQWDIHEIEKDWTKVAFPLSEIPKQFNAPPRYPGSAFQLNHRYHLALSNSFTIGENYSWGTRLEIHGSGWIKDYGMVRNPQDSSIVLIFKLHKGSNRMFFRQSERPAAFLERKAGAKVRIDNLIFEAVKDNLFEIRSANGRVRIEESPELPVNWTEVEFPELPEIFKDAPGGQNLYFLPEAKPLVIHAQHHEEAFHVVTYGPAHGREDWGIIRNPRQANVVLIFKAANPGDPVFRRAGNKPAAFLDMDEIESPTIVDGLKFQVLEKSKRSPSKGKAILEEAIVISETGTDWTTKAFPKIPKVFFETLDEVDIRDVKGGISIELPGGEDGAADIWGLIQNPEDPSTALIFEMERPRTWNRRKSDRPAGFLKLIAGAETRIGNVIFKASENKIEVIRKVEGGGDLPAVNVPPAPELDLLQDFLANNGITEEPGSEAFGKKLRRTFLNPKENNVADLQSTVLRVWNDQGSSETARRLAENILLVLLPSHADSIFSGTEMLESHFRGDFAEELSNHQFYQSRSKVARRSPADSERRIPSYSAKWRAARPDPSRVAAVLAAADPQLKFHKEAKLEILQDFWKKYDAQLKGMNLKGFEISVTAPKQTGKAARITIRKNRRVLARLGTGFQPDNLQGRWYLAGIDTSEVSDFFQQYGKYFPGLKRDDFKLFHLNDQVKILQTNNDALIAVKKGNKWEVNWSKAAFRAPLIPQSLPPPAGEREIQLNGQPRITFGPEDFEKGGVVIEALDLWIVKAPKDAHKHGAYLAFSTGDRTPLLTPREVIDSLREEKKWFGREVRFEINGSSLRVAFYGADKFPAYHAGPSEAGSGVIDWTGIEFPQTQWNFSVLPTLRGYEDQPYGQNPLKNYSLAEPQPFQVYLAGKTKGNYLHITDAAEFGEKRSLWGFVNNPRAANTLLIFELEGKRLSYERKDDKPAGFLNRTPGSKARIGNLIFEVTQDGLIQVLPAVKRSETRTSDGARELQGTILDAIGGPAEEVKESAAEPVDWTQVEFPELQKTFAALMMSEQSTGIVDYPLKAPFALVMNSKMRSAGYYLRLSAPGTVFDKKVLGFTKNPRDPKTIFVFELGRKQGFRYPRKSDKPIAFLNDEAGAVTRVNGLVFEAFGNEWIKIKMAAGAEISDFFDRYRKYFQDLKEDDVKLLPAAGDEGPKIVRKDNEDLIAVRKGNEWEVNWRQAAFRAPLIPHELPPAAGAMDNHNYRQRIRLNKQDFEKGGVMIEAGDLWIVRAPQDARQHAPFLFFSTKERPPLLKPERIVETMNENGGQTWHQWDDTFHWTRVDFQTAYYDELDITFPQGNHFSAYHAAPSEGPSDSGALDWTGVRFPKIQKSYSISPQVSGRPLINYSLKEPQRFQLQGRFGNYLHISAAPELKIERSVWGFIYNPRAANTWLIFELKGKKRPYVRKEDKPAGFLNWKHPQTQIGNLVFEFLPDGNDFRVLPAASPDGRRSEVRASEGAKKLMDEVLDEITPEAPAQPEAAADAAPAGDPRIQSFLKQIAPFSPDLKAEDLEVRTDFITPPAQPESRILDMSIAELELSQRSQNAIELQGITSITTVRELLLRTPEDLLESRNFGETSLEEVKSRLNELGAYLKPGLLELGLLKPLVKELRTQKIRTRDDLLTYSAEELAQRVLVPSEIRQIRKKLSEHGLALKGEMKIVRKRDQAILAAPELNKAGRPTGAWSLHWEEIEFNHLRGSYNKSQDLFKQDRFEWERTAYTNSVGIRLHKEALQKGGLIVGGNLPASTLVMEFPEYPGKIFFFQLKDKMLSEENRLKPIAVFNPHSSKQVITVEGVSYQVTFPAGKILNISLPKRMENASVEIAHLEGRSEARTEAEKIWNDAAVRKTIEGPRERVLPIRMGPQILRALGNLVFGETAIAAEAQPVIPQISSLKTYSAILGSAAAKRQIVDVRNQIPAAASEIDALLLYAAHHPDISYHLILTAEQKAGDSFMARVHEHLRAEYKMDLPANFKVEIVPEAGLAGDKVRHLLSQTAKAKMPAALISETQGLFQSQKNGSGGIGYKPNLLRVVGSAEALLQNAASLLAAERLLETLTMEDLIRIHQGRDLDRDNLWDALLADLKNLAAVASAA